MVAADSDSGSEPEYSEPEFSDSDDDMGMYSHLCKMYSEVGTLSTTLSGVVVVGGGGLELDQGFLTWGP